MISDPLTDDGQNGKGAKKLYVFTLELKHGGVEAKRVFILRWICFCWLIHTFDFSLSLTLFDIIDLNSLRFLADVRTIKCCDP